MFRSKVGALVFLGFIMLAVFRVVGTEDNGGELATASDRITAQAEAMHSNHPGNTEADGWTAETLADDGWGDEVVQPQG
ncbi:hypothetical protein [Erythrobacter alti]|uniref:hypothetical protein n=1 Tax=Erythrobacter alti TaxID=1896145 RepID=UPI0030F3C019